jgi:hypothetical protein
MNTFEPRYWHGCVPSIDDLGNAIVDTFIDGATKYGPWAMLSPESFKRCGLGLGCGLGQRYEKQSDGRWLKTKG